MKSKSSPGVILMAETPEQRNLLRTGWSQTLVDSQGLQDTRSPQFSIRARARQTSVSTAGRLYRARSAALLQGGKELSVEQPGYGSPARATRLRWLFSPN